MAYFRNVELSIEDFDSQEDYSRALLEQERIRKILTNVDITDAHVAKQLYEGFNQHPEMFRSIVGLEFMDVLKENSKEDDKPIEPFIYDNGSDEDNLDDTSADNIAEAEAIREESELMKPDNPEDMQQHNLQADVTVESKEATKESESDAASTDTAETTQDTPVEESDITSADTTGMTDDTSSEEAVTEEAVIEETVPESSEIEAQEAVTDVEPTDTAAMTEDTSSEEAVTQETVPESSEIEAQKAVTDVKPTDTATMTEDTSSEEAVTQETVPESSEIEAQKAVTDVKPTDTATMTEDTSSEEAVTQETVPEKSKQVTADMADGKTDSTEETVKSNPAQSNLIQNNPVQSNTSQTKLTQADFAYAGLIKWVMVLYPIIIICFPMAGAILAGICALASFIKIWGSYINNKMKTVDIFKSLLCIVIFPVGLILSVLGIMKKIKYVYYNRKAILYGCIMYMIPILFFLNVGIFSKNNMVSLIFPITKAFLDAAVLAKIGIILDIIVVLVILIIAASVFAKRLIMIIQSYIDKGLTQNEAIYFVISLPIVMICMFKTFIDGKVLFEDKL